VTARVNLRLDRDPRACFEAFCAVERIPDWVARVRAVLVRARHPDGRPAEVEFVSVTPDRGEVAYTLVYAYDRRGLRVSWRPREGEHDAVAGYAAFVADGDGCAFTYALEHGRGWALDPVDLQGAAQHNAAAFARHLADAIPRNE
jgi:hypothetical protein